MSKNLMERAKNLRTRQNRGQHTTKVSMGSRPNDEKGTNTSTTPVVHHDERHACMSQSA
jgi:hypothetical protein